MLSSSSMAQKLSPSHFSLFKNRRKMLLEYLREDNADVAKGMVILFAGFESDRHVFRQESSFYYLTGITEPGVVLCMDFNGRETVYLPHYGIKRDQWVTTSLRPGPDDARSIGVDEIKLLGQAYRGYTLSPIMETETYATLLSDIQAFLFDDSVRVFSALDPKNMEDVACLKGFNFLANHFRSLTNVFDDCAAYLAHMRRIKDDYEIDCLHKAVEITARAHLALTDMLRPGLYENQVQALIESVFTGVGSRTAFPSIVASGKNTTVLHYTDRNQEIKEGDLVVVDIGAEYAYYAADVTRTYPASGMFTDRQREVYNVVLAAQRYVESIALPGMYLNNPSRPEKSLQHCAIKYLERAGYAQYFVHGIGHFLGLDVHDVGDPSLPLEVGDVITIEPGVYIAEENLGVRIEDDYVITDSGCLQLGATLPKESEEIEALLAQSS